ncbi:Crp/Fnr family transcriptional regulator [Acetobacterium bakii]|uniref:Transcriptional regulator n=1 Tax=Acetobacterium bakii TaxID=52689 RepID=A0A0L6U1C4_9FIRM|nr:Crp/Fnr family transcriptional regulator [Acetobacterium bakii]KNZ42304.1 transcriptional regulator [Acetobacterium bakii]
MTAEEIQKLPIFSNISMELLKTHLMNHCLYVQSYFKGATVYNQSDLCQTLDIVLSGGVVAYTLSENGSATTMFEFQKGSIIGANLLFGENHAYPFNIYCRVDCRLLHISKEAVSEYLHDYTFVMHYIKSLSQNSQSMNRKITMMTQKKLRENIVYYLKQQSLIQKSSTIILPISKRELADYLGVQRPSLFRELKKLKDEEIIDFSNRSIVIKNFNEQTKRGY